MIGMQTQEMETFTQPETDLFEYTWLAIVVYRPANPGRYDGTPEMCYPYESPEIVDVTYTLTHVTDLRAWPYVSRVPINYYHLATAPVPAPIILEQLE